MNSQEFKTIYEELRFDWELECTSEEIAPLPEEKLKRFLKFQKEIHQFEQLAPPSDASEEERKIIWEVKKESSKNVDYVLNDLLAVRQEKIIQLSKRLEIIGENVLTLSEQEFYRSLLAAFKGYKKTKQYRNAIAESCPEEDPLDDTEKECESISLDQQKKIEYCDVRVLMDAPSLMGADFIIYGPFHREDIVRLPKISAKIMEKEKIIQILD
jgi:hypothetical protein